MLEQIWLWFQARGLSFTTLFAEDGQETVEFGILIATIAVVVLLATSAFGSQILPWFQNLAGRITTVGT